MRQQATKRERIRCQLGLSVCSKRRGEEMKLVITDERERPAEPDPHLIAAVARGGHWFAQIRGGDVHSARDLAERQGVNRGDVSRILSLGLLAPAANSMPHQKAG